MAADESGLNDPASAGLQDDFLHDVLTGLSQSQKSIPPRWFYDLRGSQLFEEITRLPEYYPTRVETGLLRRHARDVVGIVGSGRVLVEFGSGNSQKTPLLLREAAPHAYVPIDISGDFLHQSSGQLRQQFPDLRIVPVEADFTQSVTLPAELAGIATLGFFPGSTIGNFAPFAAVDLLRSMHETLQDGAWLLIGMDRAKDPARLLAAYDDRQGVTARFNLNLLGRINRELKANIPISSFHHVARWNEWEGRIEMHLVAMRALSFQVAGRAFAMRHGETIHTENSYKYTPQSARLLLSAGAWSPLYDWTDDETDFMLILVHSQRA